jgi:hypothetical protein
MATGVWHGVAASAAANELAGENKIMAAWVYQKRNGGRNGVKAWQPTAASKSVSAANNGGVAEAMKISAISQQSMASSMAYQRKRGVSMAGNQ